MNVGMKCEVMIMKRENPFGNVADKNPLLDGQEDNNIFNRDKGLSLIHI